MADAWAPSLRVRESAGRYRISLGTWARGEGATLAEAADDLVPRVLNVVMCLRGSGFRIAPDLGAPDRRWLDFLWELGEYAAAGGDVRDRLGVCAWEWERV